MSNEFFEPLKSYGEYKSRFCANTEEFFDGLVERSAIDINKNREEVKNYKKSLNEHEKYRGEVNKNKTYKGLVIALIVLLSIAAIAGFVFDVLVGIVSFAVAIGGVIGLIFLIKAINKKIRSLQEKADEYKKFADKHLAECYEIMAPLNALYGWDITKSLIEKTLPNVKLDRYFNEKSLDFLKEEFGFVENKEPTRSTVYVHSGTAYGSPFLLCRDLVQTWINKEYRGSITIHWTTRSRDSKGNIRVKHHSQTLTARIVKPAPKYSYDTYLLYFNDAAPNLSFSRLSAGISSFSEKEIEKKVRSDAKRFDKMAEKAIKDGGTYTIFGNEEFESLFDGTNRNHELEYRLLFTPLAQKGILELVKTDKPFGDDFDFYKTGKINKIYSKHSQKFNYKSNPADFIKYDYDEARAHFIEYNVSFFEGLYFDLAPLMSIPMYQQNEAIGYEELGDKKANITSFEYEALANSYNYKVFDAEAAQTPAILKTERVASGDGVDRVMVTAYSFRTVEHTDYVSVRGGDGRYHNVPVRWIEYIPISEPNYMNVVDTELSRQSFNEIRCNGAFDGGNPFSFERGLFSIVGDADMSKIKSTLKTDKKDADFKTLSRLIATEIALMDDIFSLHEESEETKSLGTECNEAEDENIETDIEDIN